MACLRPVWALLGARRRIAGQANRHARESDAEAAMTRRQLVFASSASCGVLWRRRSTPVLMAVLVFTKPQRVPNLFGLVMCALCALAVMNGDNRPKRKCGDNVGASALRSKYCINLFERRNRRSERARLMLMSKMRHYWAANDGGSALRRYCAAARAANEKHEISRHMPAM